MKTLMVVAALALCACASDPHEEMRADARQVDALAHELAEETERYCASAPWGAAASCVDALTAHREAVAARADALGRIAERMDGHLRDVGSSALADLQCGVPAVQVELEQHASNACGAVDAAVAEVEAQQHCAILAGAAAQLHARANAVLRATGHSVGVGGSGSLPVRSQRLPTGEHPWPWAAGAEPVGAPICAG